MDDITRRRREERAKQIAQEIDPKAGGFFRKSMERAALLGMDYVNPQGDELAPTLAKTLSQS